MVYWVVWAICACKLVECGIDVRGGVSNVKIENIIRGRYQEESSERNGDKKKHKIEYTKRKWNWVEYIFFSSLLLCTISTSRALFIPRPSHFISLHSLGIPILTKHNLSCPRSGLVLHHSQAGEIMLRDPMVSTVWGREYYAISIT